MPGSTLDFGNLLASQAILSSVQPPTHLKCLHNLLVREKVGQILVVRYS